MKTRRQGSRKRTGFFVHPAALVESSDVGGGTRIWAFAHVLHGARIGRACNIGDHCYVEGGAVLGDGVTLKNGVAVWDGVVLEDDAFVGPNAVFTNEKVPRPANIRRYRSGEASFRPVRTLVRRCVSIGANATIVCGVTVGEHAFVAAGAVVTRDLPPFSLAQGVPARVVGHVCACGERIPFPRQAKVARAVSAVCRCGRRFARDASGAVRMSISADRPEEGRRGRAGTGPSSGRARAPRKASVSRRRRRPSP